MEAKDETLEMKVGMKIVTWFDLRCCGVHLVGWVFERMKKKERKGEVNEIYWGVWLDGFMEGKLVGWVFSPWTHQNILSKLGRKHGCQQKTNFAPPHCVCALSNLSYVFLFLFILFFFFFNILRLIKQLLFLKKIFFNQREGFLVAFTSTFFFKAPLIVLYIYIYQITKKNKIK